MSRLRLNKFRKSFLHTVRNRQGQSIVLVCMMIMSFLLFFGFVINTGVLVTAKISLQTAADAAAYAGAAVQARQLNNISYLNYDLRRQYKKFAYRYIVVGNFARTGFNSPLPPQSGSGYFDFPIKDIANVSDPSTGPWVSMNLPVICIPITPTAGRADDNCIMATKPDVSEQLKSTFPAGGLSSLTQTLLEQLSAMEGVQSKICEGRGEINKGIALTWLFRGDVDQAALKNFFQASVIAAGGSTLQQTERDKITDLIATIADGLGIFPRNAVTLMRIQTLEKFLNQPPNSEVTQETAQDLEKAVNAESNERTIMAFQSARANLNSNTFPEGVTMNEIMSPVQLKLSPVKVNFTTYYQGIKTGTSTGSSGTKQNCVVNVLPISVIDLPVGVKKESGFVHYAVKLKAKARLFIPGATTIELEAIAGTKPFGSRIGPPQLDPSQFLSPKLPVGKVSGEPVTDCSKSNEACVVPNVLLATSSNTSFLSSTFLQNVGNVAGTSSTSIDLAGIRRGMIAAAAPNPAEVGVYNILPPPPTDPSKMKYEFISYWSQGPQTSKPVYRFYAPVFPAGNPDVAGQVSKFLDSMFPATQVSGLTTQGIDMATLRTMIQGQLTSYVKDKLPSNDPAKTENGETVTFAAVELPIPNTNDVPPGNFWLNQGSQVLSSWAPENVRTGPADYNGSGNFKARFGYSVKFVTLRDLINQGMPNSDPDGEDLTKVNH